MNLHWYNIITQILQFTLGFIHGIVYSMGLDKDIVTYIIISYKAFSLPRNPLCSDYSSPYRSNHRLLISIPLPFPAGHMLSCYQWVWLFGTLWTVYILYIVVCICQSQSLSLCLTPFPPGNRRILKLNVWWEPFLAMAWAQLWQLGAPGKLIFSLLNAIHFH